MRQTADFILVHAHEVVTCEGPSAGRAGEASLNELATIDDGAVAVVAGKIVAVGPTEGVDTIGDFNRDQGDKLVLSLADFGLGAAFDSAELLNATSAAATLGSAQLIFVTTTDTLWFDADGTGTTDAPVAIAVLTDFHATFGDLQAGDLTFV